MLTLILSGCKGGGREEGERREREGERGREEGERREREGERRERGRMLRLPPLFAVTLLGMLDIKSIG